MNTKVKTSSGWQEVNKVYGKVTEQSNGWRQVKRVYNKTGSGWQTVYEYEWEYTIPVGTHTNYNIGLISGLDKYHNVRIIIPNGCTLKAYDSGTYALYTSFGYGGKLTIENNGTIMAIGGRGGLGGSGSSQSSSANNGGNGYAGGSAIYVQSPLTMDNNGSIIYGRGGGGGGGGSRANASSTAQAGGGGGGGGFPYGPGGYANFTSYGPGGQPDTHATNGNAASLTSNGTGGVGGDVNAQSGTGAGSYADGGRGGTGGSSGSSATAAGVGGTWIGAGGAAGADGQIYYNPSNYTITEI